MKKLTFILLLLAATAQAQPNITQMEYFIGNDPGFSSAIPITGFTSQPDINNFINSITPSLNPGINYLGYRSKDANNVWSHTNFLTLYVVDSTQSKIAEVEYFWDVDSGFNAHSDTLFANPIADITNGILYADVPINLGLGTHILFVRSKDTKGKWSHTNYVDSVIVTGTVAISEFINQTGINVYPNPFSDNITIEPNNNETLRVTVYTIEGKKVMDKVINQISKLETQTLASGAYILSIVTDKKRIYRTTIIKD
ncbi:MAG TPA: T9SS type A sorting domain-containing protein [Bacteroidia bacterium]|nr:T9SS type A sorting domain-containing protein [Bacteroidia bacterium]HMU20245.1 T9SS type A sorting domain-containing protein [Bacteroidia bacterium]